MAQSFSCSKLLVRNCLRGIINQLNVSSKRNVSLCSACYASGDKKALASQNNLKVTIVGAAGGTGQSLALMLKQCPLVDEICLYDVEPTKSLAEELKQIDTRSAVTYRSGVDKIRHALKGAKIIVIVAGKPRTAYMALDSMFESNAPIVQDIFTHIAKHNPKAFVALATNPIPSLIPLASEILKKHGYYNPKTLFGITTLDSVRANTLVAETMGIQPECVTVPVIGGNTEHTIVPLLSHAKPCAELTNMELEEITASVKKGHEIVVKVKRNSGPKLSGAFAIARFIVSLVKALQGASNIVEIAYVKSKDPRVKYLATPLLIGPAGIVRNHGVPKKLSDYETCQLENAFDVLRENIRQGEAFVGVIDPPVCDECDPNPKAPRCPSDTCEAQAKLMSDGCPCNK